MTRDLDRRAFLGSLAALVAGAGCTGAGDDSTREADTATSTDSPTPTAEMGMPTETPTATEREQSTPTAIEGFPRTRTATATASPSPTPDVPDWQRIELTDVSTGSTFTIGQFTRKTVILEMFAVWCPVCTRQQRELEDVQGEDVVVISLNVDPNEDAQRVVRYVNNHDYGWRFAVSPPALTDALIERFGTVVTVPPSAPVVRICPSGDAALVGGRGVKSASTIRDAIDEC